MLYDQMVGFVACDELLDLLCNMQRENALETVHFSSSHEHSRGVWEWAKHITVLHGKVPTEACCQCRQNLVEPVPPWYVLSRIKEFHQKKLNYCYILGPSFIEWPIYSRPPIITWWLCPQQVYCVQGGQWSETYIVLPHPLRLHITVYFINLSSNCLIVCWLKHKYHRSAIKSRSYFRPKISWFMGILR